MSSPPPNPPSSMTTPSSNSSEPLTSNAITVSSTIVPNATLTGSNGSSNTVTSLMPTSPPSGLALQKVLKARFQLLAKWFTENIQKWKGAVEQEIQQKSGGKVRVFQTMFATPEHALKHDFKINVLQRQDIKDKFPELENGLSSLQSFQYCYIFICNDGVKPGEAYVDFCVITDVPPDVNNDATKKF